MVEAGLSCLVKQTPGKQRLCATSPNNYRKCGLFFVIRTQKFRLNVENPSLGNS